jgi:hypothetical protein
MSQTSNNSLLITPTGPFNCGLDYGTNEFSVIGDEFAITSIDSIPSWFVDIVGGIVNDNVQAIYNSLLTYNSNLLASLEQVEVAKNTYQQYINKVITDDSAYIAALSTLNSSIAGNDASIRQLLTTYATSEFAVTTAAQLLTASLNGGAIDARLGSSESTMATQYGAMAQRLDQLDTAFYDTNSQVNSTALAVQELTTYTGLGTFNGLPDVIANSNFYRTLDAYLGGTNYGTVGGTSTLLQDVTTISTTEAATVEAKFEYGSTIHLGDKDYKAGFGLVQTGTLGGDGTTYDSEFWVNASKFKVTNDVTGTTPFSIDSDGTIHLSGAVRIGGASDAPTYTSSDSVPTGIAALGSIHVQSVEGNPSITWTYTSTGWVNPDVTSYITVSEKSIQDYVTVNYVSQASLITELATIQAQLDGSITNWFYKGAPTLTNDPYSTWSDKATRDVHIGDIYYDTDSGSAYRFMASDSSYEWSKIVDTDLTNALSLAAKAQDTADGKRRVFVTVPVAPYDIGDLWNDGQAVKVAKTAKGVTEVYAASDWSVIADTAVWTSVTGRPTNTGGDTVPSGTAVDGSIYVQKRTGYTDITWVMVTGAWVKSSGSDARGVSISSSNQIFTVGSNTTAITPTSITLTANTVNFDSPEYSWAKDGTTVVGAISATLDVLNSDITSVNSISYTVTVKEATATSVTATDTFTVHKLNSGDNAVTVVLTNENYTFTATSTGSITVSDYTGKVELYLGATKVTTDVTYAVSGTPVGCTVTVGTTTGVISVTGMSANSGTATITATYNSTTYSKVLSLSKAVAGTPGSNAQYVVISGEQAFKFLSGSTTPTTISITLTAALFGGLTAYLWQVYDGTGWVDFKNYFTEASTNTPTVDNTSTLTLYYDNTAWSSTSLRIRCVSGATNDELTVIKLTDGVNGQNAVVGYLTNESVTIPATYDGTVSSFTAADGNFKVFNGTADVTSLCTFSSSGESTGLHVSIVNNTGSYTVSSMSTDTGYVTFNATYSGVSPAVTISKVFTIAKAKAGATGNSGATGSRGAYTVSYGADLGSLSISSATSSAGSYFQYGGGPSSYINGDSLVLTNSNSTSGWTNIYRYTSGVWANSTVLSINGDAVITGTLDVDKLRSGYLGNGAYYVALGGSNLANQQGAVIGFAPGSAVGVVGQSNSGTGVHGSSTSGGSGVYGYSPSGTGVSGNGGYGVEGIGTTAGGHFNSGILDVYTASSTYGKAIYAAAGDIYTTGTYAPFTGSHEALVNNVDNWVVGDIVEDTGEAIHIDISNAVARVQLAAEKSNSVVGVYTNEDLVGSPLLTEYIEKEDIVIVKTEYVSVVGDSKFIHMNALGEGLVNVCGLNGNISVGDLIVASRLPGKGMKQEDDLVRSCTVAKSREGVMFDYPEQVKLVACIYMCG